MAKKPKTPSNNIVQNKKARHEFFIEEKFEAGIALEGWEVKSLRAGKVNLTEAYVQLHQGEAYLQGCNIVPLQTASTHIKPEPTRNRKLLLHRAELGKLFGSIQAKGLTCVPLSMYWKRGKVKVEIGLAKGKKLHDKRATQKERDWNREKQRVIRER